MVVTLASRINGCSFCVDLARSVAIREHLGMEKFDAILEYRTSPLFSDRERAALAYVEEATRHRRGSAATLQALRKHLPQREVAGVNRLDALANTSKPLQITLV